MLQVFIGLAAIDNTILWTVNLKQEKHVVLINFIAIIALDQIIDGNLNFG